MSDKFKYQCKRRSARPHPVVEQAIGKGEELLGAGSGGDAGDGDNVKIFDGALNVGCSSILMSAAGTTGPDPVSPTVELLAGGLELDGRVYVRGTQGVRITSGPSGPPEMANMDINGLEMATGESQEILIHRGDEQTIQISPGLMVIQSQSLISILSDAEIELSVAGGTSKIVLTPSGIVLKGPLIQIN